MKGIGIVDIFFILFCFTLALGKDGNVHYEMFHESSTLEPYLIAYCFFRMLYCFSHKWSSFFFLFLLLILFIWEFCLGYYQLFENIGRNSSQHTCVGTFTNSGPYGCFLATCISLLIAFCFKLTKGNLRFSLFILAVSTLPLLLCTLSRTSVLSLVVSSFLLAITNKESSALLKRHWICLSMILSILIVGAYLYKKPSAEGRVLMAKVAFHIIKENGCRGVGSGHYAAAYGKAQAQFFSNYINDKDGLMQIDTIPEKYFNVADCPDYAFNEYLRVGVEYGLISMFIFISLICVAIVKSYKCRNYWCYPLICLTVFALFSYPFRIDILVLLFILFLSSVDADYKCNTYVGGLFFMILFVVAGLHYMSQDVNRVLIKESNNTNVLNKVCSTRVDRYFVSGCKSLPDGYYSESTLFLYGQFLSKSGSYDLSDEVLSIGSEISSDPMFWNVMGNNDVERHEYREAEKKYKHAFCMVPNRIYPLYLLSKMYYNEGDTMRFLKMTDVVESFRPKVESDNTKRLRYEIAIMKEDYVGTVE